MSSTRERSLGVLADLLGIWDFWGTESCNAHTGLSSIGDLSCRFSAVHRTLDLRIAALHGISN